MQNLFSFVFVPLFLLLQLFQNFPEPRNDYPLSKWGMYKGLWKEGPHEQLKIKIKMESGEDIDFFRIVVGESYFFDDLIRRKVLGQTRGGVVLKEDEAFHQMTYQERSEVIFQKYIEPKILLNSIQYKGNKLTIDLLEWDRISRHNLFSPDRVQNLFEGTIGDESP